MYILLFGIVKAVSFIFHTGDVRVIGYVSLFGTLTILFWQFLEVVSDIGFVESSGRVKRTRGKHSLVSLFSVL